MNVEGDGKPLKELRVKLQRIGIAADHGGYELKEYLAGKLREAGHEVIDFGTARLMPRCDGVAVPLEESRILWQR